MIEMFLEMLRGGAFDEWNEQVPAIAIIFLIIAQGWRLLGRLKFRFDLTKIAKVWVKSQEERARERGDSVNSSSVRTNPHPRLNVLLEELVIEFHAFRKETDGNLRDIRNEIDERVRENRREIREELDEEVRLLRAKISELN